MAQRLNSYLSAEPELRQLGLKATQLIALQRCYEQAAPPSLARASHVLKLEQQTVVLAASNGAVAAKLRQYAPELIRQFQYSGYRVAEIQVRVQVSAPPVKRAATPVVLGDTGRKRLIELAMELPDSPLRSALQRLAKRGSTTAS